MLPSDQDTLNKWVKKQVNKLKASGPKELHPTIHQFKLLIETDSEVIMFFYQMFNQVPLFPPFITDPTGAPQVQDYNEMLGLINAIMTTAPEYNDSGLVGFPINAILNWSMATPGEFAAFLNDKVNAQLKRVKSVGSVSDIQRVHIRFE